MVSHAASVCLNLSLGFLKDKLPLVFVLLMTINGRPCALCPCFITVTFLVRILRCGVVISPRHPFVMALADSPSAI